MWMPAAAFELFMKMLRGSARQTSLHSMHMRGVVPVEMMLPGFHGMP